MNNMPIFTGKTDTTPEKAGFAQSQLEKLDAFFIHLITEGKLQCANYLLALHGKIFAWKSMGRLLPGDSVKPFQPDSIRCIASTTKAFTAVAILQLAEKGKLTLEQSVSSFIKEFDTDMHRRISIFHLLTHTSGLMPDPGFSLEPYPVQLNQVNTMDDFIKNIVSGVIHFHPGERWGYSTSGFVILGEIIQRVSSLPYEEYIQKNILDPLGMTDSYFIVPPGKRERICFTQKQDNTIWEKPNLIAAGGGLYSTARDLFRFGQMMLNNGQLDGIRVVSRKAVEKMTSSQLRDVPTNSWGTYLNDKKHGLGWSMEYRSIVSPGTYGHEGGGRVNLIIDPAEELVAVYFAPTEVAWVPESIISPMAIIWSGLK